MEAKIQANAELVRKVAQESRGAPVAYDEDGVRWLGEYIDRQRESGNREVIDRLPNTLGSFLGECVRQTFGGMWLEDPDGGWRVKINDHLSVFPFNKVRKQLNSDDGESVLAFFTTIPALLDRAPAATENKPWWKLW